MLGTGAHAGADDMNEQHIVNEIEPAAPSTMSENWRTAMSKLVNEIVPLCFVHNEDFRNFAEEHAHSIGEHQTRNVDFVLGTSPYIVQKY